MSDTGIKYYFTFDTNVNQIAGVVSNAVDKTTEGVNRATRSFSNCWRTMMTVSTVSDALSNLNRQLDNLNAPGIALNTSMADLSAITGLTGEGLKKIETAARESAKAFGNDAAQSVESYKLLLSQLNPEIAKTPAALQAMGNSVSVLSKTMGGDAVAATEVLTTAMNQYQVSTDDPIAASKQMADMMNVMAAAAKEGSAELPQIKVALENAGMAAKGAGVSFEETNAAIQVLDKAGKKGAEGGMALRNVLAIMGQGRFMPKQTQAALKEVGIDVNKLADNAIPLSKRLQMLTPIMNDGALVTKMFGMENKNAAVALLNQIPELERLTTAITGTSTATEQADIVMGSYSEKMNRTKAWIDDLKISFFNATESVMPFVKNLFSGVDALGQFAFSMNAINTMMKAEFITNIGNSIKSLFIKKIATDADTAANVGNAASMGIGSIAAQIFKMMIGGVRTVMIQATVATKAFSTAIKNIPVIGWIAAAIGAIIVAIQYLWEHSKRFREILFGIWEAGKAAFYNIGLVITRLWNLIIKPYFMFWWNLVKTVFTGIWQIIKTVFNFIVGVFQWLWDVAVTVWNGIVDAASAAIQWIWNGIVSIGSVIADFFGGLWNGISELFSGIASFIDEWLIQPITDAFNALWDIIKGVFDKIWSGLKSLVQPIIDLWNMVFGDNGEMKDVSSAFIIGEQKGAWSFDEDQRKKAKEQEDAKSEGSVFTLPTMNSGAKGGLGGAVANNTLNEGASGGGKKGKSGGSGSSVKSLTVNKLVETLVLKVENLGDMSKERIRQAVSEILLTAVNDFNLSN